jgi:hypothetical protein
LALGHVDLSQSGKGGGTALGFLLSLGAIVVLLAGAITVAGLRATR